MPSTVSGFSYVYRVIEIMCDDDGDTTRIYRYNCECTTSYLTFDSEFLYVNLASQLSIVAVI